MAPEAPSVVNELLSLVDFTFVNVPTFDAANGDRPIPALDLRLAELSAAFTMNTFGLTLGEISFAESHDAALRQGTRDFCLIQKVGHMLHGPPTAVATALMDAVRQCAFLTGHIMQRGGYYYLHDQCALVNRRAWEKLGQPSFGTPTPDPQRAAVPNRSVDNVHDDYTPLFLDPTGEERMWPGVFGYGWNAISESLRHGMRVNNWSDAARDWKRNCYVYYGNPAEWQAALADVPAAPAPTDDGLGRILHFLRAAAADSQGAKRIFDSDQPFGMPHFRMKAGLECVVAPARGFEVHQILAQAGFHAGTQIVLYDSAPTLAFKRRMIESWDGRDFAGMAIAADAIAQSDKSTVEANFRHAVMRAFATEADWLAHWARFRALPVTYVTLDPVADPEGFYAQLPDGSAATVVALADHFNAIDAVARFDSAHRRRAYDRIVAAHKQKSQRALLLGQPPYVRIRGMP